MHYFVTGATGFIGKRLVARLLARKGAVVHFLIRRESESKVKALRETWGVGAARAIPVFGDLTDKDSRVSKMRELSRSYDLLDYLNLKPRTFYLARLRNPNPAIAGTGAASGHGAPAGHGGHGAGQAGKAHG